ncbi:MAG TPA: TIR domain-containing protein [Solirubrobacterales bacterium]|nr:TIR domain-containing protein [Solirubrobacterales bacterium]
MKVFISWSGDRSRDVAAALGDWLPQILPAVDPFVSTRNLAAGSRWAIEIAEELEETDFGIVCITRENQFAPWLNYEAGAIAKSVAASHLVPLAVNLAPAEIDHPLGQFQGTEATEAGIRGIAESLNAACPEPRPERYLNSALEKFWPDLKAELEEFRHKAYPEDADRKASPRREDREILEEVLQTVRGLAQRPLAREVVRHPNEQFADEVGDLLRSAGIRGWSAAYGPSSVDLQIDGQLTPPLIDELLLLGKLKGLNINVRERDRDDPHPPSVDSDTF